MPKKELWLLKLKSRFGHGNMAMRGQYVKLGFGGDIEFGSPPISPPSPLTTRERDAHPHNQKDLRDAISVPRAAPLHAALHLDGSQSPGISLGKQEARFTQLEAAEDHGVAGFRTSDDGIELRA